MKKNKYNFSTYSIRKILVIIISGILLISLISPLIINFYSHMNSTSSINVDNDLKNQKDIQKEKFETINKNDVMDIINSNQFINNLGTENIEHINYNKISNTYQNTDNSNDYLLPTKDITNYDQFDIMSFKKSVTANSLKIMDGDLLISDLKKQSLQILNDNNYFEGLPNDIKQLFYPDSNDINNVYSNQSDIDNVYSNPNDIDNENIYLNTNKSSTSISTFATNTSDALLNISYEDLYFISKLDSSINHLVNYAYHIRNIAISSTVLTIVAWATVAFYSAAWFMLGTNIPFIITGTLQASTLTHSTYLSWANYNNIQNNINILKQAKTLIGERGILEVQNLLNKYSRDELTIQNINGIIIIILRESLYELLDQKIDKVIEKTIKFLIKKAANRLLSSNLYRLANNISNYVIKMGINKTIIRSTSWVSPIANIISFIDFVLNTVNLVVDYIYGF